MPDNADKLEYHRRRAGSKHHSWSALLQCQHCTKYTARGRELRSMAEHNVGRPNEMSISASGGSRINWDIGLVDGTK